VRGDLVVTEVLAKCEALKNSQLWPPEPQIRPRAWLENFERDDKPTAAILLDRFSFYDHHLTDRLLCASYNSLADGLPKGPAAPDRAALLGALPGAFFTPVEGERPNRADSGNYLCRRARQVLRIPQERIVEPLEALSKAAAGNAVVFLDDFIGSGDQFLRTWSQKRPTSAPESFKAAYQQRPFVAAYVSLVATDYGLTEIAKKAPGVAVCTAHTLDESSTVHGLKPARGSTDADLPGRAIDLLKKYAHRLQPTEPYMTSEHYKTFGYKGRALLFAFAHCVPDATLPIFWAPGTNGWHPLLERT
jgi:hypothetical protein